ncbi:MAG: hypothetical protein FWF51_10870 [Chitinivibrionia bacterium]|nr:hypothetical protein [Chitinivibrionia bacterium]
MNNYCDCIHKLFNGIKRYNFCNFKKDKIPLNGIYILFEKGEFGHSGDRIVRIGTHTGQNNLLPRIRQHFILKNKDRSIFRKNIGRCILNKNKDDYLNFWNLDLTTRKAKDEYLKSIDCKKQDEIEKEVTEYIQNHFSFIVFGVDDKEKRLELETKIISTVSLCKECEKSQNWLGKSSPIEKIKESGLWLVQGLWKEPLNEKDIEQLKLLINKTPQ